MFAQVYAVTLLLVTFAQPFVFAANCSRKYMIKEGDSCETISQNQHVSTHQLSAANAGLINEGCTNLKAGETICLGFTNEDCSTTHVVLPSDTCQNIAARNGLSLAILYQNNPQLDLACHINAGEVLCVSQTVQVSPPDAPPPPSHPSVPEGTTITFPRRAVSTIAPSQPNTSSVAKGTTITFPPHTSTGADIVVPTPPHRNHEHAAPPQRKRTALL